ncbi:hypothetical protein BpHYR1_026701 [Brachionus plicatilis]|uniref:Uncharacterized protein n=1 Tax=Brachionus plicatilis TaxID=10195 RepID=A0A3M7Q708_BRAPC|nr:hypothetical protein BpHYR1_026701 [Brachionus plicatilis]
MLVKSINLFFLRLFLSMPLLCLALFIIHYHLRFRFTLRSVGQSASSSISTSSSHTYSGILDAIRIFLSFILFAVRFENSSFDNSSVLVDI